jgi:hypothetical protein
MAQKTAKNSATMVPCARWCARDKTAAMIKLHTRLDDDYIKPCIELQRRRRLIGAHLLTHAWITPLCFQVLVVIIGPLFPDYRFFKNIHPHHPCGPVVCWIFSCPDPHRPCKAAKKSHLLCHNRYITEAFLIDKKYLEYLQENWPRRISFFWQRRVMSFVPVHFCHHGAPGA